MVVVPAAVVAPTGWEVGPTGGRAPAKLEVGPWLEPAAAAALLEAAA